MPLRFREAYSFINGVVGSQTCLLLWQSYGNATNALHYIKHKELLNIRWLRRCHPLPVKPTPEHSDLDANDQNASPVFIVGLIPPNRRHGQQRHAYRVRGLHAHLDCVDRSERNGNTGENGGVLQKSLRRKCDVLPYYDRPYKNAEYPIRPAYSVVSACSLTWVSSGGSKTPQNIKLTKIRTKCSMCGETISKD